MDRTADRVMLKNTLRRLTHPSPPVRFALKFGTTMAATLWFAHWIELSDKVTIFITVLYVMQPTSGASIKKGIPRTIGTVASALVCIAIYGLFAQVPPLFLASVCAVIGVGTYGMTGTRYPYAWMTFAFTSVIILVKAMAGDDLIETIAFQRASETAMGVLMVAVADALFWPVRSEQRLREALVQWASRLAASLGRALDPQAARQEPSPRAQLPSSPLIPQLGLIDELSYEAGGSPARAQTFTRIALSLEGLHSRVRVIEREAEPAAWAPSSPAGLAAKAFADRIAVAMTRVSQALCGDRSPEPFAQDLDHSLTRFEEAMAKSASAGPPAAKSEAPGSLRAGALVPALQDVVAVLRNLESALVNLAAPESGPLPSRLQDTPSTGWSWLRPDPIRVQLALRAAIAAGAALIATVMMDWGPIDQVAVIMAVIVAFIYAGVSFSRGAAGLIGPGVAAGVLLGWLVADLAIIYLLPHSGRMPLALVYPFAVSGLAGYLMVRGSPLGLLGALFGLTTAILPIFSRPAVPVDVYAPYSLVCGIMLGLVIGFIAQRCLWPRTAMQAFLRRSAEQLDLCARAARGEDWGSGSGHLARLLGAYAKQQAQILQLHRQASLEPVEQALSDEFRSELLALTQELFDASLRARRDPTTITEIRNVAAEVDSPLTALGRALVREEEALMRSMTGAAEVLREGKRPMSAGLEEAHAEVDAQILALRDRGDLPTPDRQKALGWIAEVSSWHRLTEAALRIEAWIAEWQTAASVSARR